MSLQKWIKPRRMLVAVGVVAISWATLQTTEGVASGEFLTDRIGEGSVLRVSHEALMTPEFKDRILYFQDGRPVNLTQVKVEHPYCKFTSTQASFAESLGDDHQLVVKFKNVARARWFFDHGVELECTAPRARESLRESDFQKTLGSAFQLEKHWTQASWNGENAV